MIVVLERYAARAEVRKQRTFDFLLGIGMGWVLAIALIGFFR